MSTIKLENIQTRTGSGTITIGASGETVALGSGVTTSGIGKVLQVTNIASASAEQTLATTTYTDLTSLSVSITPSTTSSKILIHAQIGVNLDGDEGYGIRFLRDATNIYTTLEKYASYTGSSNSVFYQNSWTYIDSPNTTSAITYKVQAASHLGKSIRFNRSYYSNVYLVEIAG